MTLLLLLLLLSVLESLDDVIQALTVLIMPLYKADDSIDPYTLHRVPEQFIIFYSSITEDGQMWCPVHIPLYLQFRLSLTFF